MAQPAATGRCACGVVRYQVRGPLRPIVGCHCESCRRQSGHYVAATAAAADALVIVSGADSIAEWRASSEATRRFCRVCGSHLFWQRDGSATVSIMAGSLDQSSELRLSRHIFVAEKGDYYALNDGLPQHAQSSEDTSGFTSFA